MKKTDISNLPAAMSQIKKMYGDGAIFDLGNFRTDGIKVIPTGSINIDNVTGIGGLPLGRIVEIFGPESSGKTTLCLHVIAEAQRLQRLGILKGTCAFIDAEHALDSAYATRIGVDINKLKFSQPDYGEQALEIVDILVDSKSVDLIIVDSVAALVPQSEIDGEMGDASMATHARLMSKALRKLTAKVSNNEVLLIFINQLRSKIGVMFGNPEITTGGNALKFYATMRIDLRKREDVKKNEKIIGTKNRVKIVKNKIASPFRETFIRINFGNGIDKYSELVEASIQSDKVKQSKGWIIMKYKNELFKFNGRDKFRDAIFENKRLFRYLYNKCKEAK